MMPALNAYIKNHKLTITKIIFLSNIL